ncbi:uncharacterized protein Tco025E_06844 [Trypanosoma conorhini]|uniref:Uncharacterized protein n=1 Tax=Trypanosoma conorhini TaxID=83891 RepID=A0A3R7KUQ6_9TRYP|nr:uncharacterized protein Tco025E_06844 [Trypanosoma conorhini]RNF10125.1 hypothetical protein Tco025E_06844 [Trypanosoma conorhini]
MGSPVVTRAATATPAWRGSARTTPLTSPQRQHGSGASLPRQQSRRPPPQQDAREVAGSPSPALEARGRGRGLLLPPAAAMKPRTATAAAAASSVSTALAPASSSSSSSTAQHNVLPLHDQPAFRTDLVHRTVFVFGLHTVEECRALLQLLQEKCGPVAGAFRTADLTRQSDTASAAASSWGAGVRGGAGAVICVAFYRADSACMARRLDNTAQVFQKRFLVEGAARFQHLASLYESMSVSAAAAALAAAAVAPQHERLWLLLFSPTVGGATVDWQAAAAAVGRGEALLLTAAPPSAGRGGEEGGAGGVGFLLRRDHASGGRHHTHLGFRPTAAVPQPRRFDFATEPTAPTASTAPAAATSANPAGCTADALGRSNTLQQQYYSTRYESSDAPLFSLVARLPSLVLSHMFHRGSDAAADAGVSYGEAYLPAPLRQRVERVDGRRGDAATAASPVAGGGGGSGVGDEGAPLASGERAAGAAYIPRMRSVGDYVVATLPFATHLLAPLFRAGGDDAPLDDGHPTTGSRGDLSGVGGAGSAGGGSSGLGGAAEGRSGGGAGFYGGRLPRTTAFASARRKRPRDVPGFVDDTEAAAAAAVVAGNPLRGLGEGFVSLQPDTLAALSPAATPATPPAANLDAAASNEAVRAYVTARVRLRSLPRPHGDAPAPAPVPSPLAAPPPPPPAGSVWQELTSPREWGRLLRRARGLYDRFCRVPVGGEGG